SIFTIDQMGEFILRKSKRPIFGGLEHPALAERTKIAAEILPTLRGAVSSNRRVIAHFTDDEDALAFAGSKWARKLSELGTSCPDHFLRTRVCPLFLDWKSAEQAVNALKANIVPQVVAYRSVYKDYYQQWATPESPKLRDSNPSVVIVPGVGL